VTLLQLTKNHPGNSFIGGELVVIECVFWIETTVHHREVSDQENAKETTLLDDRHQLVSRLCLGTN